MPERHSQPRDPLPGLDQPDRFELAAQRARARFSAEEWVLLDPGRRSGAIYTELRRIDLVGGRR